VSDGDGGLPRWIGAWVSVVAPASLLSALLFYFGYVSARSQYEYFGVDVDAIGLRTQDFVMRSPQPLLAPLLVLTLLGAGLLILHAAIRDRLTRADGGPPAVAERLVRVARIVLAAGLVLLGAGVLLLLGYTVVRGWVFYALVTPLLLGVGGGLLAYASRMLQILRRPAGEVGATPASGAALARRAASVLVYALIAASVFWATATVAQWSGRGLAQNQARHLDRLPRVILDTKERLYLRDPVVEETVLPAAEGQTFRYRYRRLRLLIVGQDRMFLVPEKWSASNSTLVLPMDGSVRVQFQFQNEPP
jgi:hypothetical protein